MSCPARQCPRGKENRNANLGRSVCRRLWEVWQSRANVRAECRGYPYIGASATKRQVQSRFFATAALWSSGAMLRSNSPLSQRPVQLTRSNSSTTSGAMIDGTQTQPFSLNDFRYSDGRCAGPWSGGEQRGCIAKRAVTGEPLSLMTKVASIL